MVAFGFCEALNGLNRLLFGHLGRFPGRFAIVSIVRRYALHGRCRLGLCGRFGGVQRVFG